MARGILHPSLQRGDERGLSETPLQTRVRRVRGGRKARAAAALWVLGVSVVCAPAVGCTWLGAVQHGQCAPVAHASKRCGAYGAAALCRAALPRPRSASRVQFKRPPSYMPDSNAPSGDAASPACRLPRPGETMLARALPGGGRRAKNRSIEPPTERRACVAFLVRGPALPARACCARCLLHTTVTALPTVRLGVDYAWTVTGLRLTRDTPALHRHAHVERGAR